MIYAKLQEGEAFEDLVTEYSDDKGSVDKGGVLPWFGSNRMVPSFIDAVKQLDEPGDYSEPVLTDFGWHIILLKERKTPGSYEEELEGIKRNMVKDMRYQKGKQSVITRIKKEYGFEEYPTALEEIQASLDSTFIASKWSVEKIAGMNEPVFKLGNITRTQQDFGKHLEKIQGRRGIKPVKDFFREQYKIYVDEQCIAYEDKHLEEKYPEFRILMEEYRDGILLFNLTDEKVWTKAIKDSTGLEAYHKSHENDYMWEERLDVNICAVNDMAVMDQARKLMKKGTDREVLLEKLNSDTLQVVFVEDRLYSRNENDLIESIAWKKGLTDNYTIKEHPEFRFTNDISQDAMFFLKINGTTPPAPKTLDEARGLITSDYQNYLEERWIEELRQKYAVIVNREVLATIK
jgi:peptidyl-prolyl cis-trans isomerase SurA